MRGRRQQAKDLLSKEWRTANRRIPGNNKRKNEGMD